MVAGSITTTKQSESSQPSFAQTIGLSSSARSAGTLAASRAELHTPPPPVGIYSSVGSPASSLFATAPGEALRYPSIGHFMFASASARRNAEGLRRPQSALSGTSGFRSSYCEAVRMLAAGSAAAATAKTIEPATWSALRANAGPVTAMAVDAARELDQHQTVCEQKQRQIEQPSEEEGEKGSRPPSYPLPPKPTQEVSVNLRRLEALLGATAAMTRDRRVLVALLSLRSFNRNIAVYGVDVDEVDAGRFVADVAAALMGPAAMTLREGYDRNARRLELPTTSEMATDMLLKAGEGWAAMRHAGFSDDEIATMLCDT